MFIAASFTITKIWKQLKCPSVGEWIKQLWDIHTMEFYSAVKKKKNFPFEPAEQTPSHDGGVGRHTVPPRTTKRRTTTNLKTKNNQN